MVVTVQPEARLAYSSREAAKLLQVSERYLGQLKARGEIAFTQVGRVVRYSHQDLLDWLNRNRTPASFA